MECMGDSWFYCPFKSIPVILRRGKSDIERLCAVKLILRLEKKIRWKIVTGFDPTLIRNCAKISTMILEFVLALGNRQPNGQSSTQQRGCQRVSPCGY